MKRRDFITLLGGVAVAWPRAGFGQQTDRPRRIGVLMNTAESDPEGQSRAAAFRQKLHALGWTDGGNVRIDYRWAETDPDRIRVYAAELVALQPDVIMTISLPIVAALRQATSTIPIVFVNVFDPVAGGLV